MKYGTIPYVNKPVSRNAAALDLDLTAPGIRCCAFIFSLGRL